MGAEQAEGRGRVRGRSPLQCHSSPRRRVRTHARTHSHTLPRARAQAGTSARLGRAEQTRPTLSVAPRPRATPPALHPLKAIGCRGGAALGERAARATLPALHRRSRATVGESAAGGGAQPGLARSAPGARPEAAAGCGLPDATTGSRDGAGTRRQSRRYLLAQPAGWRAGGRTCVKATAVRSAELQPETRLAAWKALQEANRSHGGPAANLLSLLPP